MSSVNGARQERSTTVSRGRVHMWTRLGTHRAPRDGREGGRGARGMRWDGTERVHNGYVRQGWILLINPTGYIVPPARDGRTPLRPNHATFPKQRRRSSSPCRCSSATSAASFLDLLFSSVSTERAVRERCPFVGMSCVDAGHSAASVRRYYITLIMRACAKGGTGRPRYRATSRASRFHRPEKSGGAATWKRDGTGSRRSGELP